MNEEIIRKLDRIEERLEEIEDEIRVMKIALTLLNIEIIGGDEFED